MRAILLVALAAASGMCEGISEIREQYYGVKEGIENGDMYLTELEINSTGAMYPALGTYGRSFDFYWDIDQESYPSSRLLFIAVSSTYAAVEENEEFLFNTSGELLFYYRSGGYDMNEERFYFDGPYLQRYIIGEDSTDRPGEEARVNGERIRLEADKLFQSFHLVH
ncbi:MAG TPA: hypothetical protein P5207_04240 [Candidatus Sabulitectum sp.]|nr:hypothetical protein [Candidatus Sabulitectum sp.]